MQTTTPSYVLLVLPLWSAGTSRPWDGRGATVGLTDIPNAGRCESDVQFSSRLVHRQFHLIANGPAKMASAANSRKRSVGHANTKRVNSITLSTTCNVDQKLNEGVKGESDGHCVTSQKDATQSRQKYFYTERERYLPLANILRSIKDVGNFSKPGKNIRVSQEGKILYTLLSLSVLKVKSI